MIRTKGEAGTGNVLEAVKHIRGIRKEIGLLASLSEKELDNVCEEWDIEKSLITSTFEASRLPIVTFAAGGIATPADAAMMMQLGMDGIFVGSVNTQPCL